MGQPAWTEYSLLETIFKDRKVSEGVSRHFIPGWYYKDKFMPEYRYAVEADNKELIEEDLKSNSIMPLEHHYLLYRDSDNLLAWIAIRNDNDMFGPNFIRSRNKGTEEFPDAYNLLPPAGSVAGFMEWTFLDGQGNETDYPSFDVFVGHAAKSRSCNPSFNVVYLYKDLTEFYQSKYPEAGVRAVVVSYAVPVG